MASDDLRKVEIYTTPEHFAETVWAYLVSTPETQVNMLALGLDGFLKSPVGRAIVKAFVELGD